eukprot:scaffold11854_cov288-Ochromonas_danica.AAC.1
MYAELSYRLPGRALVDLRTAPNEPEVVGVFTWKVKVRLELHSLELAAVESLSDLVADNPFVQLLARCTSVIVTAGLEQLGPAKELAVFLIQCYKKQLLEEKWREERSSGLTSTMKTTQQS